jgi:uncharacterized protein (TIGR03437 family)
MDDASAMYVIGAVIDTGALYPRMRNSLPTLLLIASFCVSSLHAQRTVTADGQTDAYTLIQNTLGTEAETPDCSHPQFGPHIKQAQDVDLGKSVFFFFIHVTPDNDRCIADDRQRLEIKTDSESPAYNKAFLDDTVTYRWKFRLPTGFQASSSFTHIHQLKAGDGDAEAPIITLTPRKGFPDKIQILWSDGASGNEATLTDTPLQPFLDTWVEAYEKVTYGENGKYSIVVRRVRDGAILLTYSNTNIDLWRIGTTFVRPKWGIYRSLSNPSELRDEQIRFDRVCLAKGNDDCPEDATVPKISVSASPSSRSVLPGASTTFALNVSMNNVTAPVTLAVDGLPASATGVFNPRVLSASGTATLAIAAMASMPSGSYTLLIGAENAAASKMVPVTLTVPGTSPPNIQRVFNAASFADDSVGPSGWISVSGTNLSISTRSWQNSDVVDGKLPTSLNGVSVTVDGKAAAVSYISSTQINAQVPNDVVMGVPTLVQVSNSQGRASIVTTVTPFAPGLFRLSVASGRYAVAQHASDYTYVARTDLVPRSTPARRGELIILYGTGFGPTTPLTNSGQEVATPAILTNSTRVRIGGREAEVVWAGIISPGLYQLNVRVPDTATTGDAMLIADIGGATSQSDVFLTIE